MKITCEQFLRGLAVYQAYEDFIRDVNRALKKLGADAVPDLGGEPLLVELRRQIEERCNDTRAEDGSTFIEYMLYDIGGPVRTADGREFMVNTPELLWAYWEATNSGPFQGVEA